MSMTQLPHPTDPAARALLQAATERNYKWPAAVSGFAAHLRYSSTTATAQGTVHAPSPRELVVKLEGIPDDEREWITTELRSMIGHRLFRRFQDGDGRYGITFGDNAPHPYGQQLILHGDPNQSSYRVANGTLRETSRQAGPRRFTLSVQAVQELGAGRSVAAHYSVAHFDADGALLRCDVYHDKYDKYDDVWLPRRRIVLRAADGGLNVRELVFEGAWPLFASVPASDTHDDLRAKREQHGEAPRHEAAE